MSDDSRFVDYDAAFAEQEEQAKPLTRKLFGQTWKLPGVPPAAVVLRLARLMADGRSEDDLTEAETMLLAADIIPSETLDVWLAKGLGVDELGLIIEDLMTAYGPQLLAVTAADAEGNPPAPVETTPTPSSPTGASSKLTSPASTASIFRVG
jgi:hypothetical protein